MRPSLTAVVMVVAAASFVSAQEPTPRELELGQQVFRSTGLYQDAKAKLPMALGQQFMGELAAKGAKPPQSAAADFAAEIARRMDAKFPELAALAAPLAVKTFTPEELQALSDFYATPVGRSIAAKQSGFQSQAMKVTLEWMRSEMPGMIAETRKAMAAKGLGAPAPQ